MSQHYRTIASSSVPGGAGVTLLELYRTALQHITLAKLSETDFMRAPLGLAAPLNTCESSVVENIVLPCWRSGSCFLLVRDSTHPRVAAAHQHFLDNKGTVVVDWPTCSPQPSSTGTPCYIHQNHAQVCRRACRHGGGLTHYWVRL